MFETQVTVVGWVVSDVTERPATNGTRTTFRMVAKERRFNREAQEWLDGDKLFVTVVCWRQLAANVAESLLKGDQVVVSGRLYAREYEVDGVTRSTVELEARALGPDLSRCAAAVDRPVRDQMMSDAPATVGALVA